MPPLTDVTIIMSEGDAKLFLAFQANYELFKLLVDRGVFDQKNAAITMHFDSVGTLQLIQRADNLYSRKHNA